jgi:hypothetical protein
MHIIFLQVIYSFMAHLMTMFIHQALGINELERMWKGADMALFEVLYPGICLEGLK